MEKTIRKLTVIFWVLVFDTAMAVILFETGLLPTGFMPAGGDAEFVLTSLMELLAIVCIPLALRLFRIRRVAADFEADGPQALAVWGEVRLLLLGLPMLADTLLYYFFIKPTFAYLAVISLLSMLFVYPGRDRCMYETQKHDGE